jgi:hypothetical protein
MSLNAQQNEELRHAVLRVLAERFPAALTTKQVHHRVAMEIDFAVSAESVEAALIFQTGVVPPNIAMVEDEFGTTKHFRATSQGVLVNERARQ